MKNVKNLKIYQFLGMFIATLLTAAIACAQDESRRFNNPLEGYSLIVPSEAERIVVTRKQREQGRLAQWAIRNPETREIVWALTVSRAVFPNVHEDLKTWLAVDADISAAVKNENGMQVASSKVITVDEHSALQLSGTWKIIKEENENNERSTPEPDMLFREAWIQIRAGKRTIGKAEDKFKVEGQFTDFLIIRLSVVPKQNINQAWAKVIRNVRVTDPTMALEIFKRNAEKARKVIETIRIRKTLADILPERPQWFLIRRNNEIIGWMRLEGGPENREPQMDWSVHTYARSQLPKEPVRLESQATFVDKKFLAEHWLTRVQIGSGQTAMVMTDRGLQQSNRVFAEVRTRHNVRSHTEELTPFVRSIYLPRLCSRLLPKFLDLTKPETYVFAEYASMTDEFVMRTFQVVGPAMITINSRSIRTIKAIDQPNFNAEPQTLYLDAKGNVLREEMPGGYMSEAVPEETILRHFPKANAVTKAMKKAER